MRFPFRFAPRRAAIAIALCLVAAGLAWQWPRTAPDSVFVLLDGSVHRTADWRGKVTLVNFWATQCAPCLKEMPALQSTYERLHGRGFDVLAVSMQDDPPAFVIRYAQNHRLPFGVAIDNTGAIARAWDATEVTPTSFLLDQHGRVVRRFVGAVDSAELQGLVQTLLAGA